MVSLPLSRSGREALEVACQAAEEAGSLLLKHMYGQLKLGQKEVQAFLQQEPRLNEMARANPEVKKLLTLAQSLEGGLSQDQWWTLLEDIEGVAVDTGLTDLAERHDHWAGAK